MPFASLEESTAAFERTRTAVRAAGREAPVVYSAAQVLCAGGNGAEVSARADRIYLQALDMADLDHLELVAARIVPQLG